MRNILFFIESLGGGGAEGAFTQVVAHLDKTRFHATVVSERDGQTHAETMRQNSRYRPFVPANETQNPVRDFLNRVTLKASVTLPLETVHRIFLRGRYDVEVAGCEGYATKLIAHSPNPHSVKVAYVHTDFVHYPHSAAVYKGGKDEERACYEKFDHILCVSETIRAAFIETYGMEEKTRVMYNIIDDDRIRRLSAAPAPAQLPAQRPLFVMVGNFWPVKGYDRMARAVARLRDEGYRFSVVAMGIDYGNGALAALIRELDLGDYITLLGFQENPYPIVRQADAYLCTSLAEGYSTAVSEAVILGRPVLTTDCSGMREIFGDSDCGVICENSDDGIYGMLKQALDDPTLLPALAAHAARRSAAFSHIERAAVVNQFYESCKKAVSACTP